VDLWRPYARMKVMKALAMSLLALAVMAPSALGDGLPLPVDGANDASVGDVGGFYRYGAVSRDGKTTVLKITANGGQIARSRTIAGELSVPLVAYNGTAGGLSADGDTLALIRPRVSFPRRTTDFTIVDTETLRPTGRVHLNGDFSFDAISPGGGRLFLIHYQSPHDPTDYEVRAYDLHRDRLIRTPIADPSEPDEQMTGYPMARVSSPDGRWAYTLYAGGREPFVHALDTRDASAVCVDLDDAAIRDIYALGLNLDPQAGTLTVLERGDPKAVVDTRTLEVSDPPAPGVADADTGSGGSGWIGWALVGVGAALGGGLALLRWRRRRPEPGVDEEALERA
jgi:hypothetical protein